MENNPTKVALVPSKAPSPPDSAIEEGNLTTGPNARTPSPDRDECEKI